MIMDELDAILETRSIEAVWEHLTGYLARLGFDRLLYGFTRFRTANSFGDPQDVLMLSNHSADYTRHFIDENLYATAPMVRWAADHDGACSWRDMAEKARAGDLTPAEIKVVNFNVKHGVTAGYTLSFKDVSSRGKGAIGLTARAGLSQDDADAIWAGCGREIGIVCTVAHLKMIGLPYSGARRPLTARQREALEWVGDGKTMQDIAQIMGLTAATVEKHLRLARVALDVETTAQAVLKASYQNQIFALEGGN